MNTAPLPLAPIRLALVVAAILALSTLLLGAPSAQDIESIKAERQVSYIASLIDKEPSLPQHYTRMAQAYAQIGDEAQVLRYCAEAVQRGGNALAAELLIGDFYSTQGLYERALERYRTVLAGSPTQPHALTRVWMLLQRSRTDNVGLGADTATLSAILNNAGFYTAERAPANNPAAAAARLSEGNRLLNENDVRGAIAAYKEAADQDPWNPDIYRGLGIAYARAADQIRAVGAYHLYIALAPPDRPDVPKVRQIIVDFYLQGGAR